MRCNLAVGRRYHFIEAMMEQNRTGASLRSTLMELALVLDADMRLILNPKSDDEGNLLHSEELLAATERAFLTLGEFAAASNPSLAFGDEINADLKSLQMVANRLQPTIKSVTECARSWPETVEDFFICVGSLAPLIESGQSDIASIVTRIKLKLR